MATGQEEKRNLIQQQKEKISELTRQLAEEKEYLKEINIPTEEEIKSFKRKV